jgi:hypothetical protein
MLADYIVGALLISSLDEVTGDFLFIFFFWGEFASFCVPSNMVKGTFFEIFSKKISHNFEKKVMKLSRFLKDLSKFYSLQKMF